MNKYFLIVLDYARNNYLSLIALLMGTISLILLLISITFKVNNSEIITNNEEENSYLEETSDDSKPTSNEITTIRVDVKGEVNKPGVYILNKGEIILDAINMAGGLTKKANTSDINLSKELTNEMVIMVSSNATNKSINSQNNISSNNQSSKTSSKVSINTGSLSELMTLTGIGEAKAKNIISYREKNGLFKKIDDIKNVTGIGEAL